MWCQAALLRFDFKFIHLASQIALDHKGEAANFDSSLKRNALFSICHWPPWLHALYAATKGAVGPLDIYMEQDDD